MNKSCIKYSFMCFLKKKVKIDLDYDLDPLKPKGLSLDSNFLDLKDLNSNLKLIKNIRFKSEINWTRPRFHSYPSLRSLTKLV